MQYKKLLLQCIKSFRNVNCNCEIFWLKRKREINLFVFNLHKYREDKYEN